MATLSRPAQRTNPAEALLFRLRNSVFTLGFVLLAAFFVAWFVFPLYILFKVSVSEPQDVLTQHPPLLIKNFTWEHWDAMFNLDRILPPLQMSLTVATGTARHVHPDRCSSRLRHLAPATQPALLHRAGAAVYAHVP